MDTLFLLRSFGDFVIALHTAHALHPVRPVRLVASAHLQGIYKAMLPHLNRQSVSIDFVDIGIQHHLFAAFTNRYLFTPTCYHELRAFTKLLNSPVAKHAFTGDLFLEQSARVTLVKWATGHNFKFVHQTGNIYNAYRIFFSGRVMVVAEELVTGDSFPPLQKILVFPDSRLDRKALPPEVIYRLEKGLTEAGKDIQTLRFGQQYKNFEELIIFIQSADYIISSDSLPAHLAQLLNKPHAILYAKHINSAWITPYAKTFNTGFLFEDVNRLLRGIVARVPLKSRIKNT